jgi:hypothetical protein
MTVGLVTGVGVTVSMISVAFPGASVGIVVGRTMVGEISDSVAVGSSVMTVLLPAGGTSMMVLENGKSVAVGRVGSRVITVGSLVGIRTSVGWPPDVVGLEVSIVAGDSVVDTAGGGSTIVVSGKKIEEEGVISEGTMTTGSVKGTASVDEGTIVEASEG